MQNRKVAIIDDDKKFLSEIEEILLMGGYAPVPVIDGVLTVDTVIQNKPDIILMELRMPLKNGFELTDAINRIYEAKRIPIIAMSAYFKDEFSLLSDFCGIKRLIKKPFQPLDVIWAIENEIEEGIQSVDFRNKSGKYPCDQCGYIDCVCAQDRSQDLSGNNCILS